tara:strand:- start:1282 stop:1803 length:522 start_codon:yes stop_codon:yes gene_type:complete
MIIELTDLKSYLGINSPSQDNQLNPLVDYVNSYIMSFCNLKVSDTPTTYTRRVTSPTGRSVVLPSTNIQSIDSILSNGTPLDEEDYHLDADSGIIVFYIDVTTKPFGLEVTYTDAVFTAPGDLKFAALELAKYFFKDEYKNAISSGQGDSVTYEISKTIPNKIRHILVLHRVF